MAIVFCENCGSTFDSEEAKCPFCGHIYEPGAEKKYMDDLEKVRENLDHIDEEQEEMCKEEAKKKLKLILIIVVAAILVIIGIIAVKMLSFRTSENLVYGDISVDSVADEEADFSRLEELYAAGDYDALSELFFNMVKNGELSIYTWNHSTFVVYKDKRDYYFESADDSVKNNDEYGYANLLSYILEFYSKEYSNQITYPEAPQEDIDVLDGYREEILADAKVRFELTDDMLDSYLEETRADVTGVIQMDNCLEIGKRWKKGKK